MMLTLNFSKEEIQQLKYEKDFDPCASLRKRLHVIYLKMSHKMSNEAINRIVCCHRNSVGHWLNIYQSGGISSLFTLHYHCLGSKLEHFFDIIKEALNSSPVQSINEVTLRISEITELIKKPTQIRKFLVKHSYRYHKMGQVSVQADTYKQEKWLEGLQSYINNAQKGELHLLFSDAAHFTLSSFTCMAWFIRRIFLKTASGRNRINVLEIVDAITKEVIIHINDTYITAETIMKFLLQLKRYYKQKLIAIVIDNAKYKHCKLCWIKLKN